MIERTRAFRRSCEKKAKRKAQNSMIGVGMDQRGIGKLAHCHCKPCSCEMCGNPRKFFNEKTLREKRSDIDLKEVK